MKIQYIVAGAVMVTTLLSMQAANATGIETLVMPGEVVSSHADSESECSSCHVSFDREGQRALCLDCHEDVASDIAGKQGYHGLFDDAWEQDCASCHTDHEGRDADIVRLNPITFDHAFTDFPLRGSHEEQECDGCHTAESKHREAPSDCFSCHEEDNVHGETMGTDCGDCHTESEWLEVEFDHDTTDYPLVGKHAETACLDCHEDQTFQQTLETCFGCHEKDDSHQGRSGNECENCHNPTSWTDTSFDHARDTEFDLTGGHAELTCDDCHSDDPFSDQLEVACVSCHLEVDEHDGHFGDQCDSCHVTSAWTDLAFDHDVDTEHPLLGAHAIIECTECHIQPIFEFELLTACNDCHDSDDPHEGDQGIECNDCHNEETWQDKVFFDHELTRFPLLGKHDEAECDGCHDSHVFSDASTSCVDCHREEDPHEGRFYEQCADCHTPIDWDKWRFDHDVRTSFPLEGAHVRVSCNDCHRQTLDVLENLGGRCGDCHRADDIHDGEFGNDCARCHSSDNFHEVRSIQ